MWEGGYDLLIMLSFYTLQMKQEKLLRESTNVPWTDIPMKTLNLTGSQWRDKISLAILELQEKGVIQILYDKWWKNTGDVCNRDDKSKESKASALGIENIGKYNIRS
jgi:hypothetical protein